VRAVTVPQENPTAGVTEIRRQDFPYHFGGTGRSSEVIEKLVPAHHLNPDWVTLQLTPAIQPRKKKAGTH